MTATKASVDEDGGGALLAVKLSRLTARLDELQEQNGALIADKESLAAQVAAMQQVGLAVSSMHCRKSYKTAAAEDALQCCCKCCSLNCVLVRTCLATLTWLYAAFAFACAAAAVVSPAMMACRSSVKPSCTTGSSSQGCRMTCSSSRTR
jgi:hypothetical protein